MAICANVETWALVPSVDPVESCLGVIVLEASEYKEFLAMSNIWTVPEVADLQQMFVFGFSLPVIIYLVSWAYSSVINFLKEK